MTLRDYTQRAADRLQQVLHIDIRFYGRSFSLMGIAHTSGILRGLATTFLMARWLPVETFGQFRYILAVYGLAGMFSLSGLTAGVIRGIAHGDTVVVPEAMKRLLTFTPFGSLLLICAGLDRLLRFHETILASGFLLLACLFPLYCLSGYFNAILTAKQQIDRLVKIAIVNNILFATIFAAVLYIHKSLLVLLALFFGIDILYRGYFTIQEYRKLEITGSVEDHLSLGKHLSLIGVFQSLAGQLDQLLVQWIGGYSSLANYSIIILIPEQIKDFVNAMSGIILKRFSGYHPNEKILKQTQRHFWTMFWFSATCATSYFIIAPILLPLLFPQYTQTIWPSIIYCTGLISMASIIGLNYFQAHAMIRKLWLFYMSNSMMQIIFNLILIPMLGTMGAVYAKLATRLLGLPLSYPTKHTSHTSSKSSKPLSS